MLKKSFEPHKYSSLILFLITIFIVSCNNNPDWQNPKDVVIKYRELRNKNKITESYNYLADTCKSVVTQQEYEDYYNLPDSLKGKYVSETINIVQLLIQSEYLNYRCFEVEMRETEIGSKKVDKNYLYYTTFKQKEEWKIVWCRTLIESANKLVFGSLQK
jgi:hypothetical protein